MPTPTTTRNPAVAAWWAGAAALVLASTALRAWALLPSFFFADDYRLLLDASARGGSLLAHLLSPFDAQFMPGGRLLVVLVHAAGPTSWGTAAAITLAWWVAAAITCLWMLARWFGRRPAVLALLAVYLSTAITMPATMWWAASLNQLPLQVVAFTTLALAAGYLREPSWRSALPVCLALAVGLLFYVKAVLLAPVLAGLAIGWFATGGPWQRVVATVRRYHHAVVVGGVLVGAFSLFYATSVPSAVEGAGTGATAWQVADAMLGTALPVSVLGGPWQWFETSPPLVLVGTPPWGVVLAHVIVVLVVVMTSVRRRRAWRGWALVAAYAVALYALLLVTRGQLFGGFAGLELRYLTDLAAVLSLGAGLAMLPVAGAREHVVVRDWSRARVLAPVTGATAGALLATAVALGGVWSSVGYARIWHQDNAGAAWVQTVQEQVAAREEVDLADRVVPADVVPTYAAPDNRASRLVPLLAPGAGFPRTSDALHAIGAGGVIGNAAIEAVGRAVEQDTPECLAILDDDGSSAVVVEPVDDPARAAQGSNLWMRVGYLSSQASPVEVSVDGDRVDAGLRQGLHALFVRTTLPADGGDQPVTVRFSALAPGASVCLGDAVLGVPVAVP